MHIMHRHTHTNQHTQKINDALQVYSYKKILPSSSPAAFHSQILLSAIKSLHRCPGWYVNQDGDPVTGSQTAYKFNNIIFICY